MQNLIVTIESRGGGDGFIRCKDQGGVSWLIAPDSYDGTLRTRGNCTRTLCYDVRIFTDGVDTTSKDYFVGIRLQAGSSVAVYTPTIPMSEDGGAHPNWHHVCVPLGETPPPGWTVSGSWSAIVNYVTDIRFAVDLGPGGIEEIGFDNICNVETCTSAECDCCPH